MWMGPGVLRAAGIPVPGAGQPGENALSSKKQFWGSDAAGEFLWSRAGGDAEPRPLSPSGCRVLKVPPRDILSPKGSGMMLQGLEHP